MIASRGADDTWGRWPTSSHRIRLELPNIKVAQGGDLFFQNWTFFQPHRSYARPDAPNFGYSNAALLYKGSFSSLDEFSCGDFTMLRHLYAHPHYTYINEARESTTVTGASYCVLSARNNSIYKLRVEKAAASVLVVGFRHDKSTGRAAWGCLDGMCDADARVASDEREDGI